MPNVTIYLDQFLIDELNDLNRRQSHLSHLLDPEHEGEGEYEPFSVREQVYSCFMAGLEALKREVEALDKEVEALNKYVKEMGDAHQA
jgi:hypothetical protein